MTATLRYLSLFSGIGGIELGVRLACHNLGWEEKCIGFSEIDPKAVGVFLRHFEGKELKNYGDATEINTDGLPDFDLLVGGVSLPSLLYGWKTPWI